MPAKQPASLAEQYRRTPLNRRCQWCGERGYIFKLNQKFCTGRPDNRACQREDYNSRKKGTRASLDVCPTCNQVIRKPRGRPRKDGTVKLRHKPTKKA